MKTNLMHCLSSVYLVNQPLHVSGISVAHHQQVTLYIYNNWYMLCFLIDCLLTRLGWNFKKLRVNFVLNPVIFHQL